jgi:HSP20 family protein
MPRKEDTMLARMMNEFAPLMKLQSDVNRLFDSMFEDGYSAGAARPYGATWPAFNTWEDGDAAYVEAELPGLTMEDIEVSVLGREVTIGGERRIGNPDGATWLRRERSGGRFTRTLTLPWDVDADKVEAKLSDGVLTVRLPKSDTARPRKIKVMGA